MQDMPWPSFLSADPRPASPLEHSGYTKLDLMPITEDIMNHVGSLPLPGISSFHLGIDGCNSNDREQTSHLSAVQQLANFNVALNECATNLPSMNKGDADSLDASGNIECSSRQSRIFAIDELLCLSNDFIVVLKYLSLVECEINAPMDPNQPSVQIVLSLVSCGQQLLHVSHPVSSTTIKSRPRLFSHINEATMFMVVSCHCRLAETYTSIFQMMQVYMEYSHVLQMANE